MAASARIAWRKERSKNKPKKRPPPIQQAEKGPLIWGEGHDTPAECAAIGRNFERQKRVVTRFFRVTTLIFVAESVLLQKKEIESSGEFIETAQYRYKKSSRITKK